MLKNIGMYMLYFFIIYTAIVLILVTTRKKWAVFKEYSNLKRRGYDVEHEGAKVKENIYHARLVGKPRARMSLSEDARKMLEDVSNNKGETVVEDIVVDNEADVELPDYMIEKPVRMIEDISDTGTPNAPLDDTGILNALNGETGVLDNREDVNHLGDDATGILGSDSTGLLNSDSTGVLNDGATGILNSDATGVLGSDATGLLSNDTKGALGSDSTGLLAKDATGLLERGSTGILHEDIDVAGVFKGN